MKTSIVLLTTAIAIIAACCSPQRMRPFQSHPQTWVLNFNQPTFVKDVDAFTKALDAATNRIEIITIKKSSSALSYPRPVVIKLPSSLPTRVAPPQNYPKGQGPNNDSLHVTQKVTLFTDEDKKAVIDLIQMP